ncbi:MAG TPA: hypothetical protein PKY81_02685 [bacterium]|nr:hypothetical protein [bacterium]HPN29843.1 hypothetical protein [bacterium]
MNESKTGKVGGIPKKNSTGAPSLKPKNKSYAPTEKKTEQSSVSAGFINEILDGIRADFISENEASDNYSEKLLHSKPANIIDPKNKMNTESFISIINQSRKDFKYVDRHSIGKKFVSDRLI